MSDILEVSCNRLGDSSQRYFELKIKKKGETFIFNNIDRGEYSAINKYFTERNIKISSEDELIEGEDNLLITRKNRKAPENLDYDNLLPSEEDEYEESAYEDNSKEEEDD